MNENEIKELKEKLFFKSKNVYDSLSESELAEMEEYSKGYLRFIDACRIEREAVAYSIADAEKKGYREYRFGDKIEKGGKYYLNNRGKSVAFFRVGKKPVTEGVRIAAAHIDSPRLDLKQHPLYENTGIAYFKTHYYGGIKKYQWTAVPLSLHGVLVKADGEVINVNVGDDDGDPVFYISDLLIHLARNQMGKTLAAGIEGEQLNIVLGSAPLPGADKDVGERVKLGVMKLLYDKYGITEADFVTSELTMTPAMKAREVGFDRSLIAAYGHDDRVCAYPAYTALLDAETDDNTVMVVLADKEEIGSEGVTGMQCQVYMDIIDELAKAFRADPAKVRANSMCLSADVNAGFDPNWPEVHEKMNACFINEGVVLTKFTGSGGKGGTSDASGEFVGKIAKIFNDNGVVWQTGELGKVDQGGGGTVAMYIAKNNIDTVDLGVPVLSMHSPYELIAKTDLYETYRAIAAFIK
ncbi:MAG: aminopeptidase [Clostridiales bacterium]|nr:aminopeptidase [Clostridiales bacterium]